MIAPAKPQCYNARPETMPETNPYLARMRSLAVTPSPMCARQWAMVDPAIRMRAFFCSRIEDTVLLQAIKDQLVQTLENGGSRCDFISDMKQWLREHVDPATGRPYIDDEARKMLTSAEREALEYNPNNITGVIRLRQIFQTQMEMSSGLFQFQKAFTPERLRKYPAWEFYRMSGARTFRKDHAKHQGEIRLKTDFDYWMARNSADQGGFQNPFPPFGFNSWMQVLEVDRDECEDLGLLKPGEPAPMPDARYAPWLSLPAPTHLTA